MNRDTIITVSKSVIIILILLAVVFALRTPAADLNFLDGDMKGDFVDSSGLPYFSEMDSYYNLRLTEDYLDHGFVGDIQENGHNVDMHRYAPDGNNISYELGIVYVTSFFHDMANKYIGEFSVREVAFWTGAIVASLAVIPAFIFARRLTNDYGAIVATLIIVLAPNYFAHTFPGFFDTDMFYYIFSLFFIFFFVESLRADKLAFKILYAILSIVSIGLFSQSWTGYIFYVGLMGIFTVVYLILCYFFNIGTNNQSEYKNKLLWFIHQKEFISILILGIIGFVGLAIFKGIDGILGIFNSLLSLLSLQSASRSIGGFPNVLISVGEMQMPNLLGSGMGSAFLASTDGVVNGIGGISVLFAGLTVLYVLITRVFKLRSVKTIRKNVGIKPKKSSRVSASKKIDDKNKFKLKLGELGSFGSDDELSKTKKINLLYATLFVVWTLVTILAVTRGSRFITTIVLPFGLMAGIFVGYATDYIKNKLNSDTWLAFVIILASALAAYPLAVISLGYGLILLAILIIVGMITIFSLKPSKSASSTGVPIKKYIAIIAIILALISPSVCGAYTTANQVVPGTNDAMWNAMTWINQNTENNTVITSWWDFGYLFEIAADRQVTFDGGSQTGERAFWLGQAMTTDNLELSAGIFRMLDTTGDRAVATLNNYTGDTGKTTSILLEILPLTSSDARNVLMNKYQLTGEQADDVIQYTHPDNPRPVIFVASSDMLQKAGWWSYFGSWDFNNQSSENYNYYVPKSQLTLKPGTVGKLPLIEESGMIINAVISRGEGNNSTTGYTEALSSYNNSEIMINGSPYNPLNISNIIVIENGMLVKNESVGNVENANFTLFVMGENDTYTPLLIHNKLVNSMFTKLYLLGGPNQNIFTMVHMENGVSLWRINFNNTVAGSGSGNATK